MPDQSGRTTSRDFAFQSTDQAFAHPFGGAEGAIKTSFPNPNRDRYDAEQPNNASSASPALTQAANHDVSLSFANFSGQQSSLPAQAPAQFPSYTFSPGGPLVWDWNNSIEFPELANHYEPQGELVQELQNQNISSNDFSIPLPVTITEPTYQSQDQTPVANSTNSQNPLSPPPKPPSRPALQTGVKRKAESEPGSAVSQGVSAELPQNPQKRANKSRSSSSTSIASPAIATASEPHRPSASQMTANAPPADTVPPPSTTPTEATNKVSRGTGPQGRVIDVSKPRRILESPGQLTGGADKLPAVKVFPIQIGAELFKLSGASISSDEQLHNNTGRAGDVRTLYIDRDPGTFRDIALHLQGYHIIPKDGEHFVRLFADAQFYSLPRLTKQLFSTDIFIRIGGTPFQIPRDLFSSPGDSPNYFSLGFAQFFSTPAEVFPGLDRNTLLRPPSIQPPSVPNRNGETFAELIKLLQGYDVEVRNEVHRAELLRDARYFHLKGLEQRLIPCEISFNLKRNQSEILIRLEDIRQSGVSFSPDGSSSISSSGSGSAAASTGAISPSASTSKPASPALSLSGNQYRAGTVAYARPYTDDHAKSNILVLEISTSETTTLHFPSYPPKHLLNNRSSLTLNLRATFNGSTLARISSLFGVIASRMGLPATQPLGLMLLKSGGGVAAQPVSPANSGVSESRVRVRITTDCYLEIDSVPLELDVDAESGLLGIKRSHATGKRKRAHSSEGGLEDDGDTESSKNDWLWGGGRNDSEIIRDGEEHEEEWIVKRAHWRIRVEPVEGEGGKMQVVLCGVKIEGFSMERGRNKSRGFLSG